MRFSSSANPALDAPALAQRAARAFEITIGTGPAGLAVSGGSDSTALLLLAADWARGVNVDLHVATVDHGLRAEAGAEAEGVAALCRRLGLLHETLAWRPGAAPVSQADARLARHALLAQWASRRRLPIVALGHTADDRIETFLIRARAGSHWRGLAGPAPFGPSPAWPEGAGLRLARPLLAFSREALRDDLRGRAESWIEDPSNAALRFERVRMRRLAARLTPADRARILRLMDRLAELRAAVLLAARGALETGGSLSGGAIRLAAGSFHALGAEARLRLAEALVLAAGGGMAPPRTERLARLAAAISEAGGLKGGSTLAGACVKEAGGDFLFSAAPPRRGGKTAPAEPPPTPDLARAEALLTDPRLRALAV